MSRVTIFINGKEVRTETGKTIIQAALAAGIDIPHFCYHDSLGIDGNCRICLVEIEGNPKLVTSCTTPVADGMKILTNSEKVIKARAGIMEFLLLNHPLDCPVCDKAGECILQDYSYEHGYGHSRLEYAKEHFPVKDMGPKIYLWAERCIKCNRCVRFLDNVSKTGELGFRKRGVRTELDIFPDHPIDNLVSLNIVDICPVGALISKDFLFQSRVWDLKKTDSICIGCSAGCNITYWDNTNILMRITPRINESVNGHWMCDYGRETYKLANKEDRLLTHRQKGDKKIGLDEALEWIINSCEEVIDKYGAGAIAAVGSPFLTNEENYLIKYIFGDLIGAQVGLLPARKDNKDISFGDDFVIKAEKAPNAAGAREVMDLGKNDESFSRIIKKVRSGKIKWMILFNSDPELEFSKTESVALKKLRHLVISESLPSKLDPLADIILAGNMPPEKDGTYTNHRGVTQRIRRAVFKPVESEPEWKIMLELARRWRKEIKASHPRMIFEMIAQDIKYFKGIDYDKIGSKGYIHRG